MVGCLTLLPPCAPPRAPPCTPPRTHTPAAPHSHSRRPALTLPPPHTPAAPHSAPHCRHLNKRNSVLCLPTTVKFQPLLRKEVLVSAHVFNFLPDMRESKILHALVPMRTFAFSISHFPISITYTSSWGLDATIPIIPCLRYIWTVTSCVSCISYLPVASPASRTSQPLPQGPQSGETSQTF